MVRLRGFIDGAYSLPSVAVECQRCVGLYPEINEANSRINGEIGYLARVPGLRPYLSLPNSPVRGLYRSTKDVLYGVGGDHLYEIKPTNEIVDRGTLLTSTGVVSMTDNGIHLGLVDNSYGYTYQFGSSVSVAKITSGAFYPGASIDFIDGYAVVPRAGTMEYHWSSLYD
ncbi:MAG: hypothetical protein ABFE01_17370, partial [Phycisphaerales bacterium]